jgi:hypothetical protein
MQDQIRFCDECHQWRHKTNFRAGIPYCTFCYRVVIRTTEGAVDPADGTMMDSEYERYMLEPILRASQGKSRERVETALKPYIDLGRFPARRPVKRKRR